MKRMLDFLKTNLIVIKWTLIYFAFLWLVLKFLFNFNMLSLIHWHRFFHASFHGFGGFMFNVLIYSAIPIYIATVVTTYRKQSFIITIPFIGKVHDFIKNIFTKKETDEPLPEPEAEETPEPIIQTQDFPEGLPAEMHVPYMRAKNNMHFIGETSIFNKQKNESPQPMNTAENAEESAIPIPTDFDISDNFTTDDSVPVFQDINFDTPTVEIETENKKFENSVTKYFDKNNIEYETYKDFVANEKYIIYTHDDSDFWIMDEENWFAAGKQKDSPIPELLELAKQNDLTPVIYFESQNIMDFENTTKQMESSGVKVIKSLDELK